MDENKVVEIIENKKLSNQEELIAFCRLLSAACKSGKPLANSLETLNKQASSKSATWANNLANKLKQGYSIEEAVKNLKDLDPVLARLMPLLGNERLLKVFEIYTKYLIKQDICCKQIRYLVWYPLLIMIFCLICLLYLNFVYFPMYFTLSSVSGFFNTWSLKLLYFANFSYWPFSLVFPLILVYLIVDCTYFMYSGHFSSFSIWSRISGLAEATKMNEKSRLAALLSIYTEAGYSLNEAIDASINSFSNKEKKELLIFNSIFTKGNNLSESLYKSKLMADIINGKETPDELPIKFKYAYDCYNSDTIALIKAASEKLFYIPILIAGLMVLAISTGLFGSYNLFIGGVS